MKLDRGALKHAILSLCLKDAYDIWELPAEVGREVVAAHGSRMLHRELVEVTRELLAELVREGCALVGKRQGVDAPVPVPESDVPMILGYPETWVKPAKVTLLNYALQTSAAGADAVKTKKYLKG